MLDSFVTWQNSIYKFNEARNYLHKYNGHDDGDNLSYLCDTYVMRIKS